MITATERIINLLSMIETTHQPSEIIKSVVLLRRQWLLAILFSLSNVLTMAYPTIYLVH